MTDQKELCSGAAFGNLIIALFLLALAMVLIIHPVSADYTCLNPEPYPALFTCPYDSCSIAPNSSVASCAGAGTYCYNEGYNIVLDYGRKYTYVYYDYPGCIGGATIIGSKYIYAPDATPTPTPTPTPDIGECHEVCGYRIDNHCISVWSDIAAAMTLTSGVCSGFWQYAANDCPCQEGQPNVTYTPTPTPTPTPIIPVPTTHTIMPTPMVTQRYVIHPTPVAYTSMAPVTTMATLPTLPPTLFNDTYLYNQTVNSSPLSKGMIDMGVAVGDMIHYVTYPIVSMVLSPLLSMITASSDTLNQAVSMYSFFAQFPFLFLYAGVVTVSYLPNKVMFLIAFVLWVNLLFRSYDFLKAR